MHGLKKAVLAAGMVLSVGLAFAFPDKPVRLVVPYPASGPHDMAARIIAEHLQKTWNQSVVVENRPGASGAIGTDHVIKGPADGYTLLVHSPIMIATELHRPATTTYRTQRDLAPVTKLLATPLAYVVSNEWAPGGGIQEILAAAAAKPGEFSYGSHGDGTTSHYMGARLAKAGKVQMTHVPFAGEAPIVAALMGGHIKSAFLSGTGAKQVADSGKGRIIGLAADQPSALFPGIPPFAQLGFKGFDRSSWSILFAPKATPPAVVEQISRDIHRILQQPEVQKRFLGFGVEARGGTPAQTAQDIELDFQFWHSLIAEFGILTKP